VLDIGDSKNLLLIGLVFAGTGGGRFDIDERSGGEKEQGADANDERVLLI
jgi:hypothetical protein